jgi:hypothetical protein
MTTIDGSHSIGGKRRRGLGRIIGLLLLLAIVAVGVVLLLTNTFDENDDSGIDFKDDERVGAESLPAPSNDHLGA